MDLAFVFHVRRHRQRFAAATCAIIEYLLARAGIDQSGHDLAAFILDFEPAFLKAGLRLHVWQAIRSPARRDPQSVFGDCAGARLVAGKGFFAPWPASLSMC